MITIGYDLMHSRVHMVAIQNDLITETHFRPVPPATETCIELHNVRIGNPAIEKEIFWNIVDGLKPVFVEDNAVETNKQTVPFGTIMDMLTTVDLYA